MAESESVGSYKNMDEVLAAIKEDELRDQAEEEDAWLSVPQYAQIRKRRFDLTPQLVYYYARTGRVKIFPCKCGRPVVDVRLTDEFFEQRAKAKSEVQTEA